MFAALGVFSTLAPFFLFNTGLRHLSAAEAGIIASLEPTYARPPAIAERTGPAETPAATR